MLQTLFDKVIFKAKIFIFIIKALKYLRFVNITKPIIEMVFSSVIVVILYLIF